MQNGDSVPAKERTPRRSCDFPLSALQSMLVQSLLLLNALLEPTKPLTLLMLSTRPCKFAAQLYRILQHQCTSPVTTTHNPPVCWQHPQAHSHHISFEPSQSSDARLLLSFCMSHSSLQQAAFGPRAMLNATVHVPQQRVCFLSAAAAPQPHPLHPRPVSTRL